MNTEAEIHAINNKLSDIVAFVNVMKERRIDDKEDNAELKKQLADVLIAVNRLNLIVAKADGKSEGISTAMKTFRILFGGLIFVAIISSVTFMWNVNDRITALERLKG